jgi:flagellar motor switch/type III secretory pathway protein FliN
MAELLDPSRAQPLHAWSAAQLSTLGHRVQTAWCAWLRDWVPVPRSEHDVVDCGLASERRALAHLDWQPLGDAARPIAWLATGKRSAPLLQTLLFGPSTPKVSASDQPVAAGAARQAQADLEQCLRDCLGVAAQARSTLPAELFRAWSGGVIVAFGSAGGAPLLQLLLAPQTVGSLVPDVSRPPASLKARPALAPLEEALADKMLQLQVQLAPCEIELGALTGLACGDIVPLPHALDAPLMVLVEGQPVCSGFLGKQGRTRALELARETGAAAPY